MTKKPHSVFKAGDLGELINALPALFGFPPDDSLLALGTHGRRIVFGMRLDLGAVAEDGIDDAADLAVRHLERQRVEGAIVVAVGEPLDIGRRLVLAVEASLLSVRPVAGGWATDDRYWVSMAGGSPRGYAYRRTLDHPAAAQAVWEGQEIAVSRAAIASSMEPIMGERRTAIEAAAGATMRHFNGPLVNPAGLEGRALTRDHVLPVLHDLRKQKPVSDEELLRLGYLMTSVPIRDEAWALIGVENAREFVRIWLHVARHVPLEWAPPAFSLASFASWLGGDGAKAVMAAEQALRIDPVYSMAQLMLELATSGVNPQTLQWPHAS